MLPAIAPIAVPLSLDAPIVGVGPATVELEVTEDWVDEPVSNDPVEVTDEEGVSESDDRAEDVGGKVEEGVVVRVDGRVGVTFELVGVGETGSGLSVFGGVGPP